MSQITVAAFIQMHKTIEAIQSKIHQNWSFQKVIKDRIVCINVDIDKKNHVT